ATNGDEGVDALLAQRVEGLLHAILDLVWIGTRGTENRSPARKDPSAAFDIENHRAVLEHALPAVAEAHELVAVVAFPFSHDGTDDSIEARTVTATGQESYAHFPAPLRLVRSALMRTSTRAPRTPITVVMRRLPAFGIVAALVLGAVPSVARATTAGDDLRAKRAALLI